MIYYLPNQISNHFQNLNLNRDIDVLVQARKSSSYLLNELVPALKKHCTVSVINSYVDDIEGLFNRAKVYLYDSAEYWAVQNVSEGFGLQPMEAMACGCTVFSSVNGGLSDYLDPGFNCYKIANYSKEYDVECILKALKSDSVVVPEHFFDEYRSDTILIRLKVILESLNAFFDHKQNYPATIPELTPLRITALRLQSKWAKVKKKILKL